MSADPTLGDIAATGRAIWGPDPTPLGHIATCLTVIAGDLAREARTEHETGNYDEAAVRRELGNAIASAARWAEDLGLNPAACVEAAFAAQRAYVARRAR